MEGRAAGGAPKEIPVLVDGWVEERVVETLLRVEEAAFDAVLAQGTAVVDALPKEEGKEGVAGKPPKLGAG